MNEAVEVAKGLGLRSSLVYLYSLCSGRVAVRLPGCIVQSPARYGVGCAISLLNARKYGLSEAPQLDIFLSVSYYRALFSNLIFIPLCLVTTN